MKTKLSSKIGILLLCILLVQMISLTVFAAATSLPEGLTGTDGTWNTENETYSVTATGTASGCNVNAASGVESMSLKNTSGSDVVLSFIYTTNTGNLDAPTYKVESDVAGSLSLTSTMSYSFNMVAGETITFTVTTKAGGYTSSIVLSDISIATAQMIDIQLQTAENGSYTVTYGDTTETVTENKTVSVSNAAGATLVATPNDGYKFVGWRDAATGRLLSTDGTYVERTDRAVKPDFIVSSAALAFQVENGGSYYRLNDALVEVGNSGMVIVAADATVPAGEYMIPKDVTLLIPYDSKNTVVTSSPKTNSLDRWGAASDAKASVYRCLTLENGAQISVDGTISVAGAHSKKKKSEGMPAGSLGYIKAEEGSGITVNDGGNLYAWGYITGKGTVTVKNGGTVYENLQIMLWRGASKALELMDNKEKKVFMFNQYSVQNIEANLTLEAGATEKVYTSASSYTTSATLVGSNEGLFRLKNGATISRSYGGDGRITYTINGDVDMSGMNVKVEYVTMNTVEYVLQLHSNMTVDVQTGHVAINSDIGMNPGSQIKIQKDAKLSLKNGAKLVAYDTNQWFNDFCSGAGSLSAYLVVADSGNKKAALSKVDALIEVNGTLDASDGALYTTYGLCTDAANKTFGAADGGANICGSNNGKLILNAGTETVVYQYVQVKSAASKEGFAQIPIEPAKLKNEDTSFTEYVQSGTNTYTYVEDHWVCETHTIVDNKCTVCGYEESGCVHKWTDATCTTPKTCSVCGATEGEALGHKWTDANCTTPKTCSTCKKTDGNALGHNMVAGQVVYPTCTADGYTVYNCSRCTHTENKEPVSALKHDMTVEVEGTKTPATCAATGSVTMQCSRCDHTEVKTLEKDSKNHAEIVEVEAQAPTCQQVGWDAYEYCTGCTYTTYVEQPKADHTDSEEDEDHVCDFNCGEVMNECSGGEATCTQQATCDTCGLPYGNYADHVFDKAEGSQKTPATCEAPAVHYVKCDNCTAESTEKTVEVGEKLGHAYGDPAYAWSEDKTTCTASRTCANDENHVETETVNATVETQNPTCTEDGLTTYTATFEAEWAKTQTEEVVIPAKDHDWDEGVYTAPTVDANGFTTYTCNNDSSHTYVEYDEGTMLTAVAQVGEKKFATLAEALEAGNEVKLLANIELDTPVVAIGKTIDFNGHTVTGTLLGTIKLNGGLLITKDEDSYKMIGKDADYYRSEDAVFSMDGTGSITIHSGTVELAQSWWTLEGQTLTIEENAKFVIPEDVTLQVLSKVIVKGTATVDGTVNLYIADATVQAHEGLNITTTAGDKVLYQDGVYTVHSHTEDEPVVENKVDATCDADGSYDNVVYCATCGDKLSSETVTVPANGHTEGEVVVENEVAATCGTDGSYDNVVYCTVCDAELSRNTVVAPATGEHAYATEKERVEASCTEDGYLIKVCGCGAEETTVIPATGHTAGGAVKENVVDATCTTDGSYDSVVKCSICGTEISRETVTVDALGHSYDDGVVTTEPTCTAAGVKTFTCGVCGDKYTEEIAATGHNYVDGLCSVCGEAEVLTDENLKFWKISLSFQDYIGLQFIAKQSVLSGYDSHYAVIIQQKPNADKGEVTGYVDERVEMSGEISGSYYKFNKNIQSWSMTDVVTITLYGVKNGVTYKGETITTSVMEQAYLKLEEFTGNSSRCKILADMLTYGAAVQVAFNHDALDLPNAKLEELGYSSFVTTSIPEITAENTVTGTGSMTVSKTSLSLQEKVDLQLIFGKDMSGYKAVVTLTDGETFEISPDGRKFSLVALPYKMREAYTVVICNAETGEVVSPTYTYSIESVAKEKLGNSEAYDNLIYAMLNYGDSVKAIV